MNTIEIVAYIYSSLIKEGVTHEGACAVLGNIQAESEFNPINLENTKNNSFNLTDEEYVELVDNGTYTNFIYDEAGFGLAQWTFWSRKQNFLTYIKNKNKSIGDLQSQVEFLILEFKQDFSSIWNKLKTSNNLYDLTDLLLKDWENPKVKNITTRYKNAVYWNEQIKNFSNRGDIMTIDAAKQKLLEIARNEIDYHEGNNNYTKYAESNWDNQFYGWELQNQPWCDLFVDWCFCQAFGIQLGAQLTYQTVGRGSALCSASASYYQQNGAYSKQPEIGDQVFFYSNGAINHTGIVENKDNVCVYTIEGNSSDQVIRRVYLIHDAKIAGYGRPNWKLVENPNNITNNTTNIPTVSDTNTATNNKLILRRGSKGEKVRLLQEKLAKLNYDLGPDGIDGDFGENTYKAVLQFQKDYRVYPPDGEAGPLTMAALNKALSKNNGSDNFKIGQTVIFTGNTQYLNAMGAFNKSATSGEAKIVAINKEANHPYYIKHINNHSNVNGWVDADTIKSK